MYKPHSPNNSIICPLSLYLNSEYTSTMDGLQGVFFGHIYKRAWMGVNRIANNGLFSQRITN